MDGPRFVPAYLPETPRGDAIWAPYRGSDLLVKMLEGKRARPLTTGPQAAPNPGALRARLLRTDEVEHLGLDVVRSQYIGRLDGVPCIAAQLADDAPDIEGHRFGGLRAAFAWLDPVEFEAAGLGFQVQYWDKLHRFCSGCGGPTTLKTTERAKRCAVCERDFHPPVVPAVIVRVERESSILMTRQPRFPKGMYGLVAGFVEPGETLEGCVAREVLEETGIRVKNVRYFGSQPWPFPHQVMIGFTAEHESGEIVVDTSELEEAVWFDRAAMLPGADGAAPSDRHPILPPPISIARQLIDAWLVAKAG